jgi:hypothetical protein
MVLLGLSSGVVASSGQRARGGSVVLIVGWARVICCACQGVETGHAVRVGAAAHVALTGPSHAAGRRLGLQWGRQRESDE